MPAAGWRVLDRQPGAISPRPWWESRVHLLGSTSASSSVCCRHRSCTISWRLLVPSSSCGFGEDGEWVDLRLVCPLCDDRVQLTAIAGHFHFVRPPETAGPGKGEVLSTMPLSA